MSIRSILISKIHTNYLNMRKGITKQEVEALQQTDTIVKMVDIRSEEEYEELHISRVMHIPAEELKDNLIAFDKTDTIVCICNHGKERSQQAAEALYNAGFTNTFYLVGGTIDWFNQEFGAVKSATDNQNESSLLYLKKAEDNRDN